MGGFLARYIIHVATVKNSYKETFVISVLRGSEKSNNFHNVPLACEDNIIVEAHSMILSTASQSFKIILK